MKLTNNAKNDYYQHTLLRHNNNNITYLAVVSVPINGAEEEFGDFEAFCNNLKVQWVPKGDTVQRNWIVAGLAGDGKPLHICRAVYENFIIPGKYYEPHADCCYIGLYKKEVCSKDFTILASLEQ